MNKNSLTDNIEIIIPAYNEEATIASLIQEIRKTIGDLPRIVVVDDASLDKTSEVAKAHGAQVIQHPYRIGNGACVKTGLRQATRDIVVLMDGDGQHRPQDIPGLLSGIGTFDMVIGARDFRLFSLRNYANRIYSGFACYITRFRIQDLTSGFRAVKRAVALKYIYLLPNGFSYPTTLTLAFLKSGRTLAHVPILSGKRRAGTSKIHVARDGVRFFLIIVKVATFFSPLRVFLPVSVVFFFMGLAYYLYTFTFSHRFTNMSALLFTTALIIFMLGLVSEQISQLRMDRTEE